tara:strand:- start:74 stop:520 length:447 start_codon:yes stop_codon:yes gene_type:complete
MKSEPHVYSFSDLVNDKTTHWDGVRNYQARNFMRDKMKIGDFVLYYHSNTKPPHIVGIAKVCKEGYPDFTAFDIKNKYYDEKSTPENPRWMMVDIEAVEKLENIVTLEELKSNENLDGMLVIKKGQRLSIQPVEKEHYLEVVAMSKSK